MRQAEEVRADGFFDLVVGYAAQDGANDRAMQGPGAYTKRGGRRLGFFCE